MKSHYIKEFVDMNQSNKTLTLTFLLITAILFIVVTALIGWLHLFYLMLSLNYYSTAIAWFADISAHTQKINSFPYLICGFFSAATVLAYPVVLIISVISSIIFILNWNEKKLVSAFMLPSIFTMSFLTIAFIGRTFI